MRSDEARIPKRGCVAAAIAIAVAAGAFMAHGSVAVADPAAYALTYDMTGIPIRVDGNMTSEYATTEEVAGDAVAIDAPELLSDFTSAGTLRLDPCGGSLPDGHPDSLEWNYMKFVSFAGWNTAKDGRGKTYLPGDRVPVTEDTTLYIQVDTREIVTVEQLPAVAREGYAFDGWYTAKDGGTLFGMPGESPDVPMETLESISSTGLYAHWIPASSVSVPSTSSDNLVQTGGLRPDATPIVVVFVLSAILSVGFARLAKRKEPRE